MKRTLGFLALGLAGVGLAACLAGLIAIWVIRPTVLRLSVEVLDAADDGLALVDEKTKRAQDVVGTIREIVEPVTSKIIVLADKADRTPQDEKDLARIEEKLSERLRQVDVVAELAETAVSFLARTSRLTRSLPFAGSRGAGSALADDSRNTSETLSRLAKGLKSLRESLAKVRDDKQLQKEIVDTVVRLAREVDAELTSVNSALQLVRQKAAEFGADVSDLRGGIPVWTNWTALIASLFLATMALGQACLLRRGWSWVREPKPA